jgi:hypothetical protein
MNGFVIFEREDSADRFFRDDEIRQIGAHGRLVRSSREPLLIFKQLTEKELCQVRSLAQSLGGHVKSSMKYSPL